MMTIIIIIIMASCCRLFNDAGVQRFQVGQGGGEAAAAGIRNTHTHMSLASVVCHVQTQLWVIQLINYHRKKLDSLE